MSGYLGVSFFGNAKPAQLLRYVDCLRRLPLHTTHANDKLQLAGAGLPQVQCIEVLRVYLAYIRVRQRLLRILRLLVGIGLESKAFQRLIDVVSIACRVVCTGAQGMAGDVN